MSLKTPLHLSPFAIKLELLSNSTCRWRRQCGCPAARIDTKLLTTDCERRLRDALGALSHKAWLCISHQSPPHIQGYVSSWNADLQSPILFFSEHFHFMLKRLKLTGFFLNFVSVVWAEIWDCILRVQSKYTLLWLRSIESYTHHIYLMTHL